MGDNDDTRPSPESFLETASKEEPGQARGKMTIYFGAAPGVGKTYAMLVDAKLRKQEGLDIVVGTVDTHGRAETEALLAGMEIVPSLVYSYRGIQLKEMNLEAILVRRPRIVLVDELAHTNGPGLRNLKRYQDVEEILNAGINIYTTLNVQHLESVNETIRQITDVIVRETLPDTFFEIASEIKLIDLPSEELLKRLQEGKVYMKDMAGQAAQRFFRAGNLLALRELALRYVAGRVDLDMRKYMRAKAITGPWPTKERLLLAIYASPYAEQLVRSTFKIASDLDVEWVTLFVETPSHKTISDREQKWLTDALELAKDLGSQIVWIKGDSIAEEIYRYVNSHNITKIAMGKPNRFGLFSPINNNFMQRIRDVDLFLFAGHGKQFLPKKKRKRIHISISSYLVSLLAVVVVSFFGFLFRNAIGEATLLFLLLLPIIGISLFFRRGPSVFAALISIFIFASVFLPSGIHRGAIDLGYFITFIIYLAVAVVISNLASDLRVKVEFARQSEAKNTVLYGLSQELITAQSIDQVGSTIIRHAKQIYPCEVVFLIPQESKLMINTATPGFPMNMKELGVANWVWANNKPAGISSDTLPQSAAYYLPVSTIGRAKGVVGFNFENPEQVLTLSNKIVLDTIARLGALAIERIERNICI
ncbi:MAG TPA: sensor histidine kinase KdpD [Candidatus Margulisbacteria bacterium]|nr:MAG: hypothetical protein A2X43_12095 [Candidatus Margulisbacteria bacterium GWD2_39_127]HAR63869.1 sensor histidine kinase KdpD [Candidatus Margulisiibacteriota bacterium]